MSVLGLYWVCLSQWKLLAMCIAFILTICRRSLVIFRVVECLHVCGSGSHRSNVWLMDCFCWAAYQFTHPLGFFAHSYCIADLLANCMVPVDIAQISLFIYLQNYYICSLSVTAWFCHGVHCAVLLLYFSPYIRHSYYSVPAILSPNLHGWPKPYGVDMMFAIYT